MGQRHQAFIIARVIRHGSSPKNAQYRCVGALHDQWCYGRLPLKAATRFMTLIKQEDNAALIREELRAIDGLYGGFRQIPAIPDVPCPFTHFLFLSAWSAELDDTKETYKSSVISLEASMGSTEGDNNDGITVVDVTDPKNPSYCFFTSTENGEKPLSATQYVREYYPEAADKESVDAREEYVLAALRPFESVPLITIEKLAEAWPSEYGVAAPAEEVASNDQPQELPSLTELALAPALEQVLLTGPGDTNVLEIIMTNPDKISKIKEILRSRQSPIPDSGLPFLSNLLELELRRQHTKTADISQLPLSGQQILDIITQHADLDILNISHNKQVTIDVVEKLLVALPKLQRLLAVDTGVTEEDAITFLERRPDLFRNLESFIHPAFLKDSSSARFKGAYIHISDSSYNSGAYAVSLPFFTTGQIIQGLTDYLKPLVADEEPDMIFGMNTEFPYPVMAAYASQLRRPGQSWGERAVSFVPTSAPPAQSLVRKGRQWVFVLLPPSFRGQDESSVRYAFARANGEVWDETLKRMQQINNEARNSTPPMSSNEKAEKMSELREGLGTRLFHVFDVRQFFTELELEGREAPSPEALNQLFDLFSKLKSTKESDGPRLMDAEALVKLCMLRRR